MKKIKWTSFFGGNTGYGSLARLLVGLMDRWYACHAECHKNAIKFDSQTGKELKK